MSRKYKSSNTKSGYSKITFWFSQKCNGNYIVFLDFLSFTNNICLLHWLIESNTLVWTDLPLTFSYIVGYAEAFRPVQSDSQTNVWYGNDVIKVPTMYPSNQTCSCCGYKNPLVKNLSVRVWKCPACHTVHNRDTNASINILKKGLQIQSA